MKEYVTTLLEENHYLRIPKEEEAEQWNCANIPVRTGSVILR